FTPVRDRGVWDEVLITPVPLVAGDADNGVARLALPFDFAVGSTELVSQRGGLILVTQPPAGNRWRAGDIVLVNTNGRVRFSRDDAVRSELAAGDHRKLPAGDEIALYPFWADLVMSGGIGYALIGEAPHRRFVIQWDGAYR